MTKIASISQAGRDRWLQVCAESPSATFFHTPYWYEVWTNATGNRSSATAIHIRFEDGAEAIVPFSKQRALFGLQSLHYSAPAGNYGGYLSIGTLSEEHKSLLLKVLKGRGNVIVRENPFDQFPESVPFHSVIDDFTQLVDLSHGFEHAYAGWSRGHVNAVNKARRAGVIVEPTTDLAEWKTHYELYLELRKKWPDPHGRPYPWELFQALYDIQPRGVTLWVARLGGEIVSSTICLEWNRHVVAWHGAVSSARLPVRPNNFMYYRIIKNTSERGGRWFDFNPSGGIDGVVSFKKHFGAIKLRSRVLRDFSPVMRSRLFLGKATAGRNKGR